MAAPTTLPRTPIYTVGIDYDELTKRVNAHMGTKYSRQYVHDVHHEYCSSRKVRGVIRQIMAREPKPYFVSIAPTQGK